MLQQTTVAAVTPYYEKFLTRFPDASAPGRGAGGGGDAPPGRGSATTPAPATCTPAPARWRRPGGFPRDVEGLRALPGIGAYTAAAIAAIAFGLPVVPVDGNVERVVARLFARSTRRCPPPRPPIAAAAAGLRHGRGGPRAARRFRPGAVRSRRHDLHAHGARLRRSARWRAGCAGVARGIAAELPRKAPKPARPVRHGVHFWLIDGRGHVLLRRRPPRGLLGGMTELPGTPWRARALGRRGSARARPDAGALARRPARCGTGSRISNCGWRCSRRTFPPSSPTAFCVRVLNLRRRRCRR